MRTRDRLEPVPGDAEGRYRCPLCERTIFNEGKDTVGLEVRRHEGTFQVREPVAGNTSGTLWRTAPDPLLCVVCRHTWSTT